MNLKQKTKHTLILSEYIVNVMFFFFVCLFGLLTIQNIKQKRDSLFFIIISKLFKVEHFQLFFFYMLQAFISRVIRKLLINDASLTTEQDTEKNAFRNCPNGNYLFFIHISIPNSYLKRFFSVILIYRNGHENRVSLT